MSDQLCECYELPGEGVFVVGGRYRWSYIIDGVAVRDENGMDIPFDEIKWLWYFRRVDVP